MKKLSKFSNLSQMKVVNLIRDDQAPCRDKACHSLTTKSTSLGGLLIVVWLMIALGLPSVSHCEPLDYNPRWSLGVDGTYSRIQGRMGFEQQPAGYGTLNDLITDLGLPSDNLTFRFNASVRPLEHHLLRFFGSIPEQYKGSTPVPRELRFTRLPNPGFAIDATTTVTGSDLAVTVPLGSPVSLEMLYASYGLGYDLDFLVAPNWLAGLNGEFKYLDLRMRVFSPGAYNGTCPPGDCSELQNNFTDSINVDEMFPCLGGHAQLMLPLGGVAVGGFTRMNFGISPSYLNYVDMTMGLSLKTCMSGPGFMAKFGYHHESIFHDTINRQGRVMELKRDGITVALDVAF